jgi:hypothetical protein
MNPLNERPTPLTDAHVNEREAEAKIGRYFCVSDDDFACDLERKLAACREALELIIRVNSNTDSENAEDGLPDIHDIAEQALDQTK